MLTEYIQAALDRAEYEMIDDPEPFYGEVAGLDGVWATGQTLEKCRNHLATAVEDWLLFSLAKGLPIPPLGNLGMVPTRCSPSLQTPTRSNSSDASSAWSSRI